MSDGLQAIFLANRTALLRFLAARGAGEQAEDLLQELWLKIASASTGPVATPLAYLYRAAENLMRDRHRATRQAVRRDQAWDEAHSPTLPGTSDQPSGERILIGRQELARIELALAGLGERAREVFRLHRIEGTPQREIAARIGVSVSTIESDLRKAYRLVLALREERT